MGAHGAYSILEGDCAPSYLEAWLTPLGAYTLLGLPLEQLGGHTVDLVDVLGAAGRRLAEQLRDTPTWEQRFALLDRFLLRRLEDGPRPSPEVGWSHKHLITRFRQQIGLAPKTTARLIRFDRVWRCLDRGGPQDWADLARAAGYADQAHLIRDFRQFTGTTPTRFPAQTLAARRDDRQQVNFVQDALAVAS
jgi:AraC-like DNA-binding protein